MIEAKTVIRMKVPFASDVKLASQSHMYICKSVIGNQFSFVKCQRLKPYMLYSNPMRNYIDEPADITRNPFTSTTRIDCDKIFRTQSVRYSDDLITSSRPDICQKLYDDIIAKLIEDGYRDINLDENQLVNLNNKITFI